jgi:hypothetical protein
MPVSTTWDNEAKNTVLVTYSTKWTWDELYAAMDRLNAMTDTVEGTVDVIQDWRLSPRLPLNAMLHAKNLISKFHPRVGTNVYVGMNPLVTGIWNSFVQVYPSALRGKKFLNAPTLEEARNLLGKGREAGV